MAEKILVLAFLGALGIVAYDDVFRQNQFPPRPFRFVGVALVFSLLAIVAVPAPALAAAFGVAADLGFALKGVGAGTPSLGSVAGEASAQVPQLRGSSTVAA